MQNSQAAYPNYTRGIAARPPQPSQRVTNQAMPTRNLSDPFGPQASARSAQDPSAKDQTLQDYNLRQMMHAAVKQASTTSYGFYVANESNQGNFLIPAIPRKL